MGCSNVGNSRAGGPNKSLPWTVHQPNKKYSALCTFPRKVARELSKRADDLFERSKELVNETKKEIAAQLDEAEKPQTAEKSKAKAV